MFTAEFFDEGRCVSGLASVAGFLHAQEFCDLGFDRLLLVVHLVRSLTEFVDLLGGELVGGLTQGDEGRCRHPLALTRTSIVGLLLDEVVKVGDVRAEDFPEFRGLGYWCDHWSSCLRWRCTRNVLESVKIRMDSALLQFGCKIARDRRFLAVKSRPDDSELDGEDAFSSVRHDAD